VKNTALSPNDNRGSTKATSKTVATTPRFIQLWKRIAELRETHKTLRKEMQAVLRQFHTDIRPLEHRYTKAVADKTHSLIEHYRHSPLTSNDQSLLGLWIHELIAALEQHPFAAAGITSQLIDQWHRCLGQSSSPVNQQLHRLATAQLGRPNSTSHSSTKTTHEFATADNGNKSQGSDSSAQSEPISADKEIHDALVDSLSIDRLFRKLAHALHPDRESDENRKSEKDQLMSECLQARRDRDLPTLMALYQTWVGDLNNVIAADEIPVITATLERQVRQWQRQIRLERNKDPLHHQIFERYFATENSVTQHRINCHAESLRQAIAHMAVESDQLTTIEGLQTLLQARRDIEMDRAVIDELTGC